MQQRVNAYGIFSMWATWAIGLGALIVVLFISPHVSKLWLPLVVFLIEFLLFVLVRFNRESRLPVCYLIPFVSTRILFWSVVIMVAINMMSNGGILSYLFDAESLNPEIPFVPVLIISPVSTIVSFWAHRRGATLNFCEDCVIRHGTSAERGFLGNMFSQEARYQIKLFCIISLALSLITWVYYVFVYINVNLNEADKFFYVWLPVIIYVFSLVYLGVRYFTVWLYYCQYIEDNVVKYEGVTTLRYIVFCDDCVFLKLYDFERDDPNTLDDKYDTPARLNISFCQEISDYRTETYLRGLTGLDKYELKLLYVSTDFSAESNIFHYACFVENRDAVKSSRLLGEWYTLPQLKELIKENKVASIFCSEFNRIYTISMAWKTYDRSGRRLYGMRNYRPTFRLQDIKGWDVDYNDREWLFVARNNEDRSFYRLKRFWRRIINGVSD